MIINQADIAAWESSYRVKLINSISGYKSVHLIGTKSRSGNSNLAIFNSVVHIGSNPPQLGFIMRPLTVKRDTYTNILETGFFTINHVHKSFLKQAHYTAAKLESDTSEFDLCNLKEEYSPSFSAPFVKESSIKLGLKLVDDITIKSNGTHLIIGEVELIHIDDDYIEADGQLDLQKANDVCVTGLNQYSSVSKFVNYPYARLEEAPNFYKKVRPDNVAFDEKSQSYNASLLPYGTSIGAPSIANNSGLATWKSNSISGFNHMFKDKIERIKNEYQALVDEYNTNETLYKAAMGFEPVIGTVYHLYARENTEEQFLSLIPPNTWNKKHLGSFKLTADKIWKKLDANEKEND